MTLVRTTSEKIDPGPSRRLLLSTTRWVCRTKAGRAAGQALLIVVLSAAGLAACSNSSPTTAPVSPAASTAAPVGTTATPPAGSTPGASATSAGSLDACALLSVADASKVLGEGAVQAKPMPGGGWIAGQCAWNGPGSGFLVAVGTADSIAAAGDPATPDAKAMFTAFQNSGTATDVPGIGDGAALGATGLAGYKDGTYLRITNLGLTEDQLVEIARRLVAKV